MARKIQLKNKSGEILHPETEASAITDLVANPGGSGLTELTSLRIGNTSYRVAANPNMSGFATTEYVDNRMNAVLGTGEIAQAYDTVKEISDYITTHGSEYADIVNNLGTINSSIATLNNANLPSRVENLEKNVEWWMIPVSGTVECYQTTDNTSIDNNNPFKKLKFEDESSSYGGGNSGEVYRKITAYNGYDEPTAYWYIQIDCRSRSFYIQSAHLVDSNLLSQSELNRAEFKNLYWDGWDLHMELNNNIYNLGRGIIKVIDLPGYDQAKGDILNSVSLPEVHSNLSWYDNDAGFITSTALNGYALQANVPSALSDLNNDTGFITGSALENYALESYVDNAIGNISIPSAVSDLTNDTGFITASSLSGLASESYVNTQIGNIAIPTLVSQLTNDMGYITSHQSLANYATKNYVDTAVGGITVPTKVSDLTNDAGYLTEHQSLTGLATEQYVDNAIDEILGEGQISANFDTIKEVADYLTQHGSDYTALVTAVQGKADASAIPTKVSDLQNDAGYLTSHQSLSGYATESYVNTAVAGVVVPTKVSDLTNDSAFITAASLPTKADYIYVVDYAHPNFAEATAAFNAGKVVLLKGAAPDANGYAVLNYVSNSYITFSKFLTSRSRNYASFNTYYLTSENTWSTGSTVEGAREVVLNAVTGNPTLSGSEASLNSIKIGATSYKIPQPDLSTYALKSEIPAKVSDITNDTGFITASALQPYALAVDVPTKVSDLQNDSGFLTSHQDISGKQDVLTAGTGISINANNVISVSGIQGISYEVISEFPQEGAAGKIYLKSKGGRTKDVYEEYIWVNNDFELIGSTAIDLSGYAQTANLAAVATSGDYDDLINKPTLFSGDYDDLTNKPTIPSLSGYATESYVDSAINGISIPDASKAQFNITSLYGLYNQNDNTVPYSHSGWTLSILPDDGTEKIERHNWRIKVFNDSGTVVFDSDSMVGLSTGSVPTAPAGTDWVGLGYLYGYTTGENTEGFEVFKGHTQHTWTGSSDTYTVSTEQVYILKNSTYGEFYFYQIPNPVYTAGSGISIANGIISSTSTHVYTYSELLGHWVTTGDNGIYIDIDANGHYFVNIATFNQTSNGDFTISGNTITLSNSDNPNVASMLDGQVFTLSITSGGYFRMINTQLGEYQLELDAPDKVSGTSSGNNWTSLTINGTTKNIPAAVDTSSFLTSSDLSGYALSSAIPTATSDLTNDSGFLTSSDISIPANVSDLNDDVGIITSSDLSDYATESYVQTYVANNASSGGSADEADIAPFNISKLRGLYHQNDNTSGYNHSGYNLKIENFDKGDVKTVYHTHKIMVYDNLGNTVYDGSNYCDLREGGQSYSGYPANVPSGWTYLGHICAVQPQDVGAGSGGSNIETYFFVFKGSTTTSWTNMSDMSTDETYIITNSTYGEFFFYSDLLIPNYTAGSGITISNGVISSSSSHVWTYEECAGHWPAEQPSGIYVDVNSDGSYAVFFPAGTFGLPSDTTATGDITLSGASLTLSNTQPAMLSSYLDGAEFALSIDNEGKFHMTHSQFGSYEKQLEPGIREKYGEPDLTQDGTYVLKATVSNGAVTYSWVLEA